MSIIPTNKDIGFLKKITTYVVGIVVKVDVNIVRMDMIKKQIVLKNSDF